MASPRTDIFLQFQFAKKKANWVHVYKIVRGTISGSDSAYSVIPIDKRIYQARHMATSRVTTNATSHRCGIEERKTELVHFSDSSWVYLWGCQRMTRNVMKNGMMLTSPWTLSLKTTFPSVSTWWLCEVKKGTECSVSAAPIYAQCWPSESWAKLHRRLLDLMILSYHTLSLRRCRILDWVGNRWLRLRILPSPATFILLEDQSYHC